MKETIKQRLNIIDINELTSKQKDNLRELWQPEVFDVILVDEEEVSIIDFYLGKKKLMISTKDLYGDYEEVTIDKVIPV